MASESRTKNSTRNALAGAIVQFITILIQFVIRTIFIKVLGVEYLGVNGLFTNILTVLSFAELGIGNAIIFSMYKTIADEDKEKTKSLMKLYKKAYNVIGLVVLVIGLAITPFINLIIKDAPDIRENIHYIYILFLLNTVMSYFFTYKKSIILAHQKAYIVNICKLIAEVLKTILQIVILYVTKNFVLYLIVQIACTLLDNVLASIIANKMFPYLKDKDAEELDKQEKKVIYNNVKSLVLYKFGSVILNGTDNIIISKMLGIAMVGIVSNFNMLINTVSNILGNALNGFTASIGNLNVNDDKEKQEEIFKQLFFLCVWIYGFCAIAFIILANPFVEIWVGREFLLPISAVIAMSLHLYVTGVQFVGFTYRTTLGLFNQGKYSPIVASVINIVLSILFGKVWGVTGILLATSISRLATTTWLDIYLVHKYRFKKSPAKFYLRYLICFLIVIFVFAMTYVITNSVRVFGILGFVIKLILSILIPNIMFLIIFFRTNEFKELVKRIKGVVWKKKAI